LIEQVGRYLTLQELMVVVLAVHMCLLGIAEVLVVVVVVLIPMMILARVTTVVDRLDVVLQYSLEIEEVLDLVEGLVEIGVVDLELGLELFAGAYYLLNLAMLTLNLGLPRLEMVAVVKLSTVQTTIVAFGVELVVGPTREKAALTVFAALDALIESAELIVFVE